MNKPTFSAALAAVLSLVVGGCNNLTGAEDVWLEGEVDEGQPPGKTAADPPAPGPSMLVNCAYSPQTPGVKQNQQIPAVKHWVGYLENQPTDATGDLDATDYYDCNGSKGINALVFETSQYG